MNRITLSGLLLSGLLLGGCQQQVQSPMEQKVATAPAATPISKEVVEPEVKAIQDEFNKLDADTDFPTFNDQDLQK